MHKKAFHEQPSDEPDGCITLGYKWSQQSWDIPEELENGGRKGEVGKERQMRNWEADISTEQIKQEDS